MNKKYTLSLLLLLSFTCVSLLPAQSLIQVGYYNRNGLFGIASKGQYMVLSNGEFVDNSDPTNPTLQGQYSFNGDGTTVIVDGDYGYFGTGMVRTLFIANIANPFFPLQESVTPFQFGNGIFGMDISNDVLYLAMGMDGVLTAMDVSNKAAPVQLDTLMIPGGQCRDVVTMGTYAFAAHATGLKVIDISTPSNMQVLTSIGSGYNSIALGDGLVFMGKTAGGVDVFDISNPTSPAPAFAILNSGGTAWDLRYANHHLYLSTNSDGLYAYKIANNMGTQVAHFPNTGNGQSFGVHLQDSLVLLSGLVNGLAILRYDSLGTVGVMPPVANAGIRVYPNPAQDQVQWEGAQADYDRVELLDLQGRLVADRQLDGVTDHLDLRGLPAGQYFLRFSGGGKVETRKLAKRE